jgi:hypothetical protein
MEASGAPPEVSREPVGSDAHQEAATAGEMPSEEILGRAPQGGVRPVPQPPEPEDDPDEDPDFEEDEDEQEMSSEEASRELGLLMSQEPPPPATETVNLGMLAERLGVERFRWTLRSISPEEIQQIEKRSMRDTTKAERVATGLRRIRDQRRYAELYVAAATVDPDLTEVARTGRFGPAPEYVVRAWLLEGEIENLFNVATELAGWGEKAVERAKES